MGSSSFADAARAKKVLALVRHFDRLFIAVGRCPYREADALAEMLRESISEDDWKRHAVIAGVKPPSADSVAMVIHEYEERAAARIDMPVRMFGGIN